jgi:hypothetical protein
MDHKDRGSYDPFLWFLSATDLFGTAFVSAGKSIADHYANVEGRREPLPFPP